MYGRDCQFSSQGDILLCTLVHPLLAAEEDEPLCAPTCFRLPLILSLKNNEMQSAKPVLGERNAMPEAAAASSCMQPFIRVPFKTSLG